MARIENTENKCGDEGCRCQREDQVQKAPEPRVEVRGWGEVRVDTPPFPFAMWSPPEVEGRERTDVTSYAKAVESAESAYFAATQAYDEAVVAHNAALDAREVAERNLRDAVDAYRRAGERVLEESGLGEDQGTTE